MNCNKMIVCNLFTTHKRSFGKVIFLQLSVILFTLDGDPLDRDTPPGQRHPLDRGGPPRTDI